VSHKTEPAAIISSEVHSSVVWRSTGGRNKGCDAVARVVVLRLGWMLLEGEREKLGNHRLNFNFRCESPWNSTAQEKHR
jgi:hypothetical protein